MTIGTLCWAAALSLLPVLGSQQEEARRAPSRARTDAAIMDIVTIDLLSAKDSPWEDYSGSDRPEPAKRRIRLSAATENYGPREDAIVSRQYKSDWDKLSKAEMEAAREAMKNLLGRASEKEWLKDYRPKDRRIVLVNGREEEEKVQKLRRFERPQIFRAYPPGYTKDGKTACVHLWYPWSGGFHSGVATYVLALREGKWVVLVRQFIRYV